MTAIEERINALFKELVPVSGKADTIAGEMIRAISRIGYRYYNDGDHLGIGYGRETCNPAGRYLAAKGNQEIARLVQAAWGIYDDRTYEMQLARLEEAVVAYIEAHPELRQQENTEELWDYCDPYEDVDNDDEDEEDW